MGGLVLIVLCAALGCTGASATPATTTEPTEPNSGILAGVCEPSAIVGSNGGLLVGDNETSGHLPAFTAGMERGSDVQLALPVDDIEALALGPTSTWVVGSHSRNKSGEDRPLRRRILELPGQRLVPLDLAACAECVAATHLAPNLGGFNIEGAAVLGDRLVLGLRGPLVDGRALLLVLPAAGPESGRVERVVKLDLAGDGIRDLAPWKQGLLVVSGPVSDAARDHRLWWLPTLEGAAVPLAPSLPPSTEGLWALNDHQVITVQDGDGNNGDCRVPGTWTRIEVALP